MWSQEEESFKSECFIVSEERGTNTAGSNNSDMDPKNKQTGGVRKGGGQHVNTGKLDDKRKKTLKLATWNKGGANQELKKKRNEIMLQLLNEDIDCLGVTEANLRAEADIEEVAIPGYVLKWDSGKDNNNKWNSREVVYIKEELSCDVLTNYMKNDLMPEIWLCLGHRNTKRTVVGFVYREHTPWGTQNGSVKEQETAKVVRI